jgi:competence protein ComEA
VQSVAAIAGAQQQDAPGDTQRVRPRRKAEPTEPININTASKAELMTLPGVGEVIAERILEYRRTKRFETPEELMEVKGIGPKKFERLRPYIRVR